MHKLGRKTRTTKAMKSITLLLPACATIVGQEEACANAIPNPKEVITTKSMPTTWKKNISTLLPTCATITIAQSPTNCATTTTASSLLV